VITDPIFYRLFESSPETFFLLLGMSADSATQMAARYQYQAIEFKETSHRVDGIFLPKEPGLPLYFLEVQFYPLPNVFADLMVKAFTYLKQNDPGHPFRGVVLFASRSLEPTKLEPYQPLMEAGVIQRFYLDEMQELSNAPVGLSILYLIRQTESQAPAMARELVARAKTEVTDSALRVDLIEFIETIIMYKVPRLTREEIKTMLQLHDIRESRAWQEAREEGLQAGRQEGRQAGRQEGLEKGRREGLAVAIAKMAAQKMPAKKIAAILQMDIAMVHRVLKRRGRKTPRRNSR
jgi:predicted transposase/invertase (TIGR01784 family)